jgi:hypothetical protein
MDISKRAVMHIIILLIVISILSGCKGSSGNPKQGAINQIDYHTGSQGIVLRFLPGSPPTSLYKGDPLSVVVEYSNKGAFDVNGGQLYISGYDNNYVTFTPDYTLSLSAKGKSEFNPLGDLSNTFEFNDDAVSMPARVDSYSPKFLVTACYKYKTEAYKEACIDPDPYTIAPQEKVCIVHDLAFGTQGAPVAVTSAQEVTSRNRVQFKVFVSNVGGGTVIDDRSSISDCHVRLKRTDIDKVRIVAKFSDKQLKCEPEIVPLVSGSGISICSYEGNLGNEAYLTVLNIELFYGYRTSIQGLTNIYRIPGREY